MNEQSAEKDATKTVTEWGVVWPHGEVVWTPGGEATAREMAAMKGTTPYTRQRTSYADTVTDWEPVGHQCGRDFDSSCDGCAVMAGDSGGEF